MNRAYKYVLYGIMFFCRGRLSIQYIAFRVGCKPFCIGYKCQLCWWTMFAVTYVFARSIVTLQSLPDGFVVLQVLYILIFSPINLFAVILQLMSDHCFQCKIRTWRRVLNANAY